MMLGACMLAPLVGGFAGAAINTTPLMSAGDPLATIPQHESDFSGDIAFGGLDTPDHYPLVTPQGTVPVEELVFHGGLGRRYEPDDAAPRYAASDPRPAEPASGDPADQDATDGESQRLADIAGLVPVGTPQAAPHVTPLEVSPQLPAEVRPALATVRRAGSSPDGDAGVARVEGSTT